MTTLPAGPLLDLEVDKAMDKDSRKYQFECHNCMETWSREAEVYRPVDRMICPVCANEYYKGTGRYLKTDDEVAALRAIPLRKASRAWSTDPGAVGHMMEWLRIECRKFGERLQVIEGSCDDFMVGTCTDGESNEPMSDEDSLPHALSLAIVAISARPAPAPEKE